MASEVKMESWQLVDYCKQFAPPDDTRPDLTMTQVVECVDFLRQHNYPKPLDCPAQECKEYRPACALGVCKIAALLCGDW